MIGTKGADGRPAGGFPCASRARLKIFLGYAPGVGKTSALLAEGRRLRIAGVDAVAGFVQTRGRSSTVELMEGLEVLSGTSVAHADPSRAGFDLDAALARKPGVLLLDDIEQPNPSGSRHARRWQDLVELLEAGITVLATLDAFRLESLNDVVRQITGARVRDTVPDSILERADDIVLVDCPPEELIARVGESAVDGSFLEPGRLAALRSLALRRAADRVDSDIRSYRLAHGIGTSWPPSEFVLSCVGPSPSSAGVVRAAARLAAGLHARWIAAGVETPRSAASPLERQQLQEHLRLAELLGGEVIILSGRRVGEELLRYAHEHNATRIVVGRPTHSPLHDLFGGSIVNTLVRGSRGIEVHVIAGTEDAVAPERVSRTMTPVHWAGFALALALVTAVTTAAWLVRASLPDTEIVMAYLLAIMIVAFLSGRGPALAAAALSVAAYDVFFVPPLYRFTVADIRHVLTFAMMFAVGLAISSLTGMLRRQSRDARLRERRTADLYALVRELADAADEEQAAGISARHAAATFAAEAVVLLRSNDGGLRAAAASGPLVRLGSQEESVARWVGEHGRPAGRGTDTHAGSSVLCTPIATGERVLGVLVLRPAGRLLPDSEQRGFLEAFVRQIALAIERVRLSAEARVASLRARTEEIRSSLLSAVSHDLRTPLAAITGAGSALRLDQGKIRSAQRSELVETVCDEAARMDRLIGDLLDMVRLETGTPVAKREWVPLEELVGPALERLEDRLAGCVVRVDLPANLPLLSVDPVLFEHLFYNLIENAVKHAAGPIDVSARADEGWVQIEVADRGPGLPPGTERSVFEKFYRGPGARDPGMGLGLSICRSIVQIHDGSISAENRSDGGALFRIRLPMLERPPDIDPRVGQSPAREA
jgi:two-component system sensor histidine kinase KdpD